MKVVTKVQMKLSWMKLRFEHPSLGSAMMTLMGRWDAVKVWEAALAAVRSRCMIWYGKFMVFDFSCFCYMKGEVLFEDKSGWSAYICGSG